MSIRFACPSCGAVGSVDAALFSKHVRCKHCKYRFAILSPGKPENEGYALDGPIEGTAGGTPINPEPGSAFIPRRGDEPTTAVPRKIKRASPRSTARRRESGFARRPWLIRGMIVAVLAAVAIALFAPRGTLIVGSTLTGLGSLMVMVGYGAGAYGAFREDVLLGMLYLLVPLYAAYYLVSRWDDLWIWFACSTAGVILVMLGTEMIRWNGTGA